MKQLLITLLVIIGGGANLHAQTTYTTYSNPSKSSISSSNNYSINSTLNYSTGYSSTQIYNSSSSAVNVHTNRNYNSVGGYNSTTSVLGDGFLRSSSTTIFSGSGNYSTYKTSYDVNGNYKSTTIKTNYGGYKSNYKF